MTRRTILAAIIGLVTAAICARLGMWQLDRLEQRRAYNHGAFARMQAEPVEFSALPTDTTARFRRVRLSGQWDFDREFVLTHRSHNGSPGVHIVTPLLLADGSAVPVIRGWVYSPDAAGADLERWRSEDSVVQGWVTLFAESGAGDPRLPSAPRAWRRLDGEWLERELPYPVAPFAVVASHGADSTLAVTTQLAGEASPGERPVRLSSPSMDEGSHRGYAMQWFAFATIALGGAGVLIRQERRGLVGRDLTPRRAFPD